MGKKSRDKGKVGEREWVHLLISHGFEARRTQQHSGEKDAFDVVGSDPVGRWEVKRRESLYPMADILLARAREEAGGEPCALAWRRNEKRGGEPGHGRWVVMMDAHEFFELLKRRP